MGRHRGSASPLGLPEEPWNNPDVWPAWGALLPHVLAATDVERDLEQVLDDVPWLLDRAATYRQARGEPRAARPLFERANALNRSRLGDDHSATLISANDLAANLRALGEYERARKLDQDTLDRRRRVLGEDHPHTLASASNLADNLRRLGEYEQARALDERTLARRRWVLGDDHPDTLASARNLATI